ncbi:MAG TPA: response regulator [Planctomycetaceae bacterium]|nr:response regulator [Planctomycetaceae bacterium]
MSKPSILVVDDDRTNCAILSKMLSAHGYQVDTANSGEQALKLVEERPYVLVLLDYVMPGMDGVELYRRIRQLRPETIGVFQTAFARIEVIYSAIDAGAERVLAKPIDSQELLPLVDRLVEKGAPPAAESSEIAPHVHIPVPASSQAGAEIERRLRELDQEWSLERALEAQSAMASVVGATLGAMGRRRWYLLPIVAGGFLLQHAMRGSCLPAEWLRRMNFRPAIEIERERTALRALARR